MSRVVILKMDTNSLFVGTEQSIKEHGTDSGMTLPLRSLCYLEPASELFEVLYL